MFQDDTLYKLSYLLTYLLSLVAIAHRTGDRVVAGSGVECSSLQAIHMHLCHQAYVTAELVVKFIVCCTHRFNCCLRFDIVVMFKLT